MNQSNTGLFSKTIIFLVCDIAEVHNVIEQCKKLQVMQVITERRVTSGNRGMPKETMFQPGGEGHNGRNEDA